MGLTVHRWMTAFVFAAFGGACAIAPADAEIEPAAFDANPICASAAQSTELALPERVAAVLENADGRATPDAIADAILQRGALQVAASAPSERECLDRIRNGDRQFARLLRNQRRAFARRGGFEAAADPDVRAVQEQITALWRADQAARQTYVATRTHETGTPAYLASERATAHTVRVDGESTAYIESLLAPWGWIDIPRFGASVSAHAWILVQHADRRPDLQADVLSRMEPFVESGDVTRRNYAFLWDRVAINTDRPQRYGTQPIWECGEDGSLQLHPLKEPETVNERRAAMGLGPVAEGLAEMALNFCGPRR